MAEIPGIDPGFRVQDSGSSIQDPGSRIQGDLLKIRKYTADVDESLHASLFRDIQISTQEPSENHVSRTSEILDRSGPQVACQRIFVHWKRL